MFGWLPDNVSTDAVFHALYWGVTVAMVLAQLALARGVQTGTRAREVVWAVVPVVLLLSFGTASYRVASAHAASQPGQRSPASSAHDGERHGR